MEPDYNRYLTEYWSNISRVVSLILADAATIVISFQDVYTLVYKSVCNGFSEKMYKDLIDQCTMHVDQVNKKLSLPELSVDNIKHINAFSRALHIFLLAVDKICPIFGYLNKFYIESSLKTNLFIELLEIFNVRVIKPRIYELLGKLEILLEKPFAIQPEVAHTLINNLYRAYKDKYSNDFPTLFKRYIPGFQFNIPTYYDMVEDSKVIQAEALTTIAEYNNSSMAIESSQRGQKRNVEEDMD